VGKASQIPLALSLQINEKFAAKEKPSAGFLAPRHCVYFDRKVRRIKLKETWIECLKSESRRLMKSGKIDYPNYLYKIILKPNLSFS